MLNRLLPLAYPLAQAHSGWQLVNASADDLALLALFIGLMSTSTSALRLSSMPESELRRTQLTLDGSNKVLARSI